jgi:hypothetical protein
MPPGTDNDSTAFHEANAQRFRELYEESTAYRYRTTDSITGVNHLSMWHPITSHLSKQLNLSHHAVDRIHYTLSHAWLTPR